MTEKQWEERMHRWGLMEPDDARNKCLELMNAEYKKIESELPEKHGQITTEKFEEFNDRMDKSAAHIEPYVGQEDSEVRQALITRIAAHYNVDYDQIYCIWLGIDYDPTNYADYKGE